VVHETDIIIAKIKAVGDERREKGKKSEAYLRVQLVYLFNGCLDITRVDRTANIDSFLNRPNISFRLDVGLDGKSFCCSRIAIGHKVVHD
jgi:hypothetical protein